MDGCYYCYECHEATTATIPARIIHNWDFAQYPVSKAAHDFLRDVHSLPLLDLRLLNPLLYKAFPEVESIRVSEMNNQLCFSFI
jgi:run domain Beclin-1 interacting cysteine-rich containing protein